MAHYAVGDIQGCFNELQLLLKSIHFKPEIDTLWCCGDMVSRGPQSLEVLRFLMQLPHCKLVLGNHDLTLLAIDAGIVSIKQHPTLAAIMNAHDRSQLIQWLRQQPLLYLDPQLNWAMVHAGIPPQWSLSMAKEKAQQVEARLQAKDPAHYKDFLRAAFSLQTTSYNEQSSSNEKLCYISNALSRMRFVTTSGKLDLIHKNKDSLKSSDLIPWFECTHLELENYRLCFGHWAALNGECSHPNIEALDTGCVWGHQLTALCLETRQRYHIKAHTNKTNK